MLFAIPFALKAENSITANSSFQPATLSINKQGLLNITIEGVQGNILPIIPEVEGLTINYFGTQQYFTNLNGSLSMAHVFSFSVVAQKTGDFFLPSFNIEIDGKKYPVTPSKLTVIEGESNINSSISFKFQLQNSRIYLGQFVPIEFTLSASKDIKFIPNVNITPLQSDFFKGSSLSTKQAVITNTSEQAYSFSTLIIPTKAGEKILQYKIHLAIQKPRSSKRKSNSLLDQFDYLDDLFPTAEEVELLSNSLNLSILPLPIENKPTDFTGAIGQFNVENLSINSQDAQVGDPLTLKLEITGKGNFDRITAPTLSADANWKTYPPKATFTPKDSFGYEGSKTFEYIIIPQFEEISQSPTITFNFFDPERAQYMELTPNPLPLNITQPLYNLPSATSHKELNLSQSSLSPSLLPIKLQITHTAKSLNPLITQRNYILYSLSFAFGIALLFTLYNKVLLNKKNNSIYKKETNLQKSIRLNLQKAKKAYGHQEASNFYKAATTVILELISRQYPKPHHSLTIEDLNEYFASINLPETDLSFINTLFHTADIIKFSGSTINQTIPKEIFNKFETFIQKLEK